MSLDCKKIQHTFIQKNEIHLLAEDEDIECDTLVKDHSVWKMIQNKDHKFLAVDEGFLKYEYRNKDQCKAEDSCFIIQMYRNYDSTMTTGQPVILQVIFKGEKYVVCCCEEGSKKKVYPKLQEPTVPDVIEDDQYEAVFLLQRVQPSTSGQNVKYRLESAKWPRWFLSFDDTTEPVKVVLNKIDETMVNERIIVTMTSPTL